jgi:hypothetical protein
MAMYAPLLLLLSWLLPLHYDENRRMGDVSLIKLHAFQGHVLRLYCAQKFKTDELAARLRPLVKKDMDEFATEELVFEMIAVTKDTVEIAEDYLYSQEYRRWPPPVPPLKPAPAGPK